MPLTVFGQILIGFALSIVSSLISVLLTPSTSTSKEEVEDLESPTSSAGREIPVVFGTLRVHGVNNMWYGEKTTTTRKIS